MVKTTYPCPFVIQINMVSELYEQSRMYMYIYIPPFATVCVLCDLANKPGHVRRTITHHNYDNDSNVYSSGGSCSGSDSDDLKRTMTTIRY